MWFEYREFRIIINAIVTLKIMVCLCCWNALVAGMCDFLILLQFLEVIIGLFVSYFQVNIIVFLKTWCITRFDARSALSDLIRKLKIKIFL